MMQPIYYAVLFGISFFLTFFYILLWHRQLNTHMTAVFILMPIANLAYLLMHTSHGAEAVGSLMKVVYICGCFLPWMTMMCVMGVCDIQLKRVVRISTFLLSSLVFFSVLTIGYFPLFYRSLSLEKVGDVWIQHKVYGPFHTLHYVCLLLYFIVDLYAIIYSYRKKKQVSRRILFLLFLPIPVSLGGYFMARHFTSIGYELMPLTYVFAQFVYLLIVNRMALYNVSEMVVESMVQSGDVGFITVDSGGRYLGSNQTARVFLPALERLAVDQPVRREEALKDTVTSWLDHFQQDPDDGRFLYTRDGNAGEEEMICLVSVSDLHDGRKKCGFQIFLQDDTQNQKYIRLMDRYNADLQDEVAVKTGRIEEMQDRLILGMAAMVESRDNSTGGHIRRTSEGVRILVGLMKTDPSLGLTDSFCRKLIKAAPMHDLGKIAVDDAVLRKPGRFTPEEFEKMKSHAAEGARIVHNILQDTDDAEFLEIAENVAHFHHERWDGSGYPEGLKGEEIPLEARIMAIADVYDALVSKRVYKEKFSFEKADGIISGGMGTQFDPGLAAYYSAARPELEAYYLGNAAEEA